MDNSECSKHHHENQCGGPAADQMSKPALSTPLVAGLVRNKQGHTYGIAKTHTRMRTAFIIIMIMVSVNIGMHGTLDGTVALLLCQPTM